MTGVPDSLERRLYILGAGGQAREARQLAALVSSAPFAGYVCDTRPADGSPWAGPDAWLASHEGPCALVLGVGSPALRLALMRRFQDRPNTMWPTLVHPRAVVDRAAVKLGPAVYVGPGAVLTVDIEVAAGAMINFGATVGHDVRVGPGSVVHPQAAVSGGVTIGAGAMIGAAACILPGLTIGPGAQVGAGAVVTRDVAPRATVTGSRARPRTS